MSRRTATRDRLLAAINDHDTLEEVHEAYGPVRWATLLQAVQRFGLQAEFQAKFGAQLEAKKIADRAKSGQATAERNRVRGAAAEAALIEDAEFLLKHGETKANAPKRLGYNSWEALYRALERAGRTDIAAAFTSNDEFPADAGLGGAVRGGKFVMHSNANHGMGWRFPS